MPRKPKPKPVGRPVSTGRGHDGHRVNVRLSADEFEKVSAAADRDGAESVASWVRAVALLKALVK
jgi:hypothetical protein